MHIENLFSFKDRKHHSDPFIPVAKPACIEVFKMCGFKFDVNNNINLSFYESIGKRLYVSVGNEMGKCSFYLEQVPFNCGAIILGHFSDYVTKPKITPEERVAFDNTCLDLVVRLCRAMDYSMLINTTNDSSRQLKLLVYGFKDSKDLSFINARTGNRIYTSTLGLMDLDLDETLEELDDEEF